MAALSWHWPLADWFLCCLRIQSLFGLYLVVFRLLNNCTYTCHVAEARGPVICQRIWLGFHRMCAVYLVSALGLPCVTKLTCALRVACWLKIAWWQLIAILCWMKWDRLIFCFLLHINWNMKRCCLLSWLWWPTARPRWFSIPFITHVHVLALIVINTRLLIKHAFIGFNDRIQWRCAADYLLLLLKVHVVIDGLCLDLVVLLLQLLHSADQVSILSLDRLPIIPQFLLCFNLFLALIRSFPHLSLLLWVRTVFKSWKPTCLELVKILLPWLWSTSRGDADSIWLLHRLALLTKHLKISMSMSNIRKCAWVFLLELLNLTSLWPDTNLLFHHLYAGSLGLSYLWVWITLIFITIHILTMQKHALLF